MIHVVNFRDKIPPDGFVVNATSRSDNWSKGLSPFLLGPCELYGGYVARNMENSWQFCKVYSHMVDSNGDPSEVYWEWAKKGWNDDYAHRYPAGKGAIPLYSYWDGEKLDYIEARKRIYIPLYSTAVRKSKAYETLVDIYENLDTDLYVRDFDAYYHRNLGMTYDDVINNPDKKMGHGFVLAMMLEGFI